MEETILKKSDWMKSAFMSERALPQQSDQVSSDTGMLKAQQWKSEIFFNDDKLFATFLEKNSISLEDFQRILATQNPAYIDGTTGQNWLDFFEAVMSDENFEIALNENKLKGISLPFAGFFVPFIRISAVRLDSQISQIQKHFKYARAFVMPSALEQLIGGLNSKLLSISAKTLVLELNIARLRGLLQGESPESRFNYFSKVLLGNKEKIVDVLKEYPALARYLVTYCQTWLDSSVELLERLSFDLDKIEEIFNSGNDLGEIVEIDMSQADSHCNGRSVAIIKFRHGLKLVYKPRPAKVNVRFQQLLLWLNQLDAPITQYSMTVIDRNDYSWSEFVPSKPCKTEEDLKRFYLRQGSYLAIIYILNGVDFHRENLIAFGEYPVLVDLEGLFHHDLISELSPIDLESAQYNSAKMLENSVLKVGLLPRPIMSKDGKQSYDLSGLGGIQDQKSPFSLPLPEKKFTDEMHFSNQRAGLKDASNIPEFGDQYANAYDYVNEIVEGFEKTYFFIRNHESEFKDKILEFSDVDVRQIFRPTAQYVSMLTEISHPDHLRDGLLCDRIFNYLWAQIGASGSIFPSMVASEIRDLHNGDIPYFYSKPNQRDVWDSERNLFSSVFARASIDDVLLKLENLNEKDCQFQVSLIRSSMLPLKPQISMELNRLVQHTVKKINVSEFKTRSFVDGALLIGERLKETAIFGKNDVSWIGVDLQENNDYASTIIAPLPPTLYLGLGGIALFLGYLAEATGRSDFLELSEMSSQAVRRYMASSPLLLEGCGVFTGRASALYTMYHLARLWGDEKLKAEVRNGWAILEQLIRADKNIDILSGSAGMIIFLTGLLKTTIHHNDHQTKKYLVDLINLCVKNITDAVTEIDDSMAWKIPVADLPLSGFAHGVAGIICALLLATDFIAEVELKSKINYIVDRALIYERKLFDPEQGNWLDIRNEVNRSSCMTAWCNGAPGIVLGRLLGLPYFATNEILNDIQIGLKTTVNDIFAPSNYSLCHGLLGNSEILYYAGLCLGENKWKEAALQRAMYVAEEIQQGHWICGLPSQMETPGLMLGIAGMGMSLLHLSHPTQVPSVLRLGFVDGS